MLSSLKTLKICNHPDSVRSHILTIIYADLIRIVTDQSLGAGTTSQYRLLNPYGYNGWYNKTHTLENSIKAKILVVIYKAVLKNIL